MSNFLLDTHAFIWFIEGNEDLSIAAREAIEDPEHQRFLSIASLWEMSIKASLGKLQVTRPISQLIKKHVEGNDIQVLSINGKHLDAMIDLPMHHRDPFDRLMLAQSTVEDLVLISRDGYFKSYDVDVLW